MLRLDLVSERAYEKIVNNVCRVNYLIDGNVNRNLILN